MITSAHNPRIKWVRSLQASSRQRREDQAFAIEGVRLAEEALAAGWQARLVLFSEGLSERGAGLLPAFAAQEAALEEVTPAVMRAASDTQTPQGILVVLSTRELPPPVQPDFVLVADGVRDPGNLGSLLRTAAAAGVQQVYAPQGSVDLFAPKVVRAGMGAHFRLPLCSASWEQIAGSLRQAGLRVYLADASASTPYTQADLRQPLALVIGSEAAGPGDAARQVATARLSIPMPGGMESLNAAAAAAILLFEVVRQRSG